MTIIEVGCQLDYRIHSPASLLLNLSVAQNDHPTVTSESLEVLPFLVAEQCDVANTQRDQVIQDHFQASVR